MSVDLESTRDCTPIPALGPPDELTRPDSRPWETETVIGAQAEGKKTWRKTRPLSTQNQPGLSFSFLNRQGNFVLFKRDIRNSLTNEC